MIAAATPTPGILLATTAGLVPRHPMLHCRLRLRRRAAPKGCANAREKKVFTRVDCILGSPLGRCKVRTALGGLKAEPLRRQSLQGIPGQAKLKGNLPFGVKDFLFDPAFLVKFRPQAPRLRG